MLTAGFLTLGVGLLGKHPWRAEIEMADSVQRLQTDGNAARQLGRSLSRAFHGEPNFTYIIPDDAKRAEALAWFFGVFLVRLGLRYGEIYTTPEGAGVAVWMRPGQTVGFAGAARAGALSLPFHLGWGGFWRSIWLSDQLEKARKRSAPERHWYLMALGVDPARQRQGLGGALIEPVLSRADAEGTACYLETFSERNLPFYRRHGFEVSTNGRAAKDGPSFWGMLREPPRRFAVER